MKVIVRKPDGTEDTFGDVMSIRTNAETDILDVSYSNASGVHSKSYVSGQWHAVEIDPRAPVDYDQPKT